MVRELDFTVGMVGLLFSFGSIGLLVGSYCSYWLTKRLGLGRALALGFLIMGASSFVVPLAGGPILLAYGAIVIAEITFLLGLVIWNIGQVSLRQASTPDRLLGRITSLLIVAARIAIPPGALAGGFLGEFLGLRESLLVFAMGISLSFIWLIVFRIWNIREMPVIESVYSIPPQ